MKVVIKVRPWLQSMQNEIAFLRDGMSRAQKIFGVLTVTSLFLILGSLHASERPANQPPSLPNPQKIPITGPIHFQARNIVFHVMAGVHLNVQSVDALLTPTNPGRPVVLDDPNSMRVKLLSGHTSISAEDMTTLLANYALPRSNLPLREVQVSFADGEVQIRGKVHKLIDLPFKASATIGVTPRGNFHLHFDQITAAGFLHKRLLDLLGLSIADLAKPGINHSFHIHGDDVDFPINMLFPAPSFSGRMRSATIDGDKLVQIFGVPRAFAPAPVPAEHYVYFRGGILSFGRLTMQGVDLEMLNKDADEKFELSLKDLFQQVLPGYIKNLPDRGIVGYLESYHDGPESPVKTVASAEKDSPP